MATKKKPVAKTTAFRSFKRSPDDMPFYTFRFTRQTVYWIVITFLVLAIGTWVLYLTVRVQRVYDLIHVVDTDASEITTPTKHN
jgi:hypothetical protein